MAREGKGLTSVCHYVHCQLDSHKRPSPNKSDWIAACDMCVMRVFYSISIAISIYFLYIIYIFISPSWLWFVSISFSITKSHFNCNSFLMWCDVWRVLCNWICNEPHHHTRRIKCALSVVIAQPLPPPSLYYPFGFHFSFAHFLCVASSAHGRVHLSTTLA